VRSARIVLPLGIAISISIRGAAAPETPAAPEKPLEQKRELLWRKLEREVSETASRLDGVAGVAIRDLTSGETLLLNGDELFPQASSIKIAVLAELYHQDAEAARGASDKAKRGDLYTVRSEDVVQDSDILQGLTPGVTRITNRDLATMMVAVSDNGATNVLIDRLGMENVNAFLESLGLRATRLRRRMMDLKAAGEGRENVATPREMMTLLETIWSGKAFDKERTADFWKVLSTPKESALRRGLPAEAVSATKPGSLEAVRNDSGVVFAPNRPFVLCVMTTYLKDEKAGEEAISKIAGAAWSYFERVGRASPLGRVISTK
jgi:beta-lactamase class A